MDPAEAVVKPGCKQQVSVLFRAEANRAWAATLGLDISERDPRDQHNGIPYELGGDSCIPGEGDFCTCHCGTKCACSKYSQLAATAFCV